MYMCVSVCFLQDGLVLCHWRRVADEGKEYPFAKFNKSLDIPTYTEEEYTVSGSCDCHVTCMTHPCDHYCSTSTRNA